MITYSLISVAILYYVNFQDGLGKALLYAGLLGSINVFLNIFFAVKNLKKPDNDFIKSFWMSIFFRMLILLGMFFTILIKVPLNHFVFTVAFFILYFLFQIIEIYILHTAKLFR